jgi:tetrahydromethanopterin S-methyltransferase subunit G
MGVIEDVRQVLQDFLAPELREIRGRLDAIDDRIDAMEEANRARFEGIAQRLDGMEIANTARFENIVQRLDTIQQSFAFDKRISDLEADKRRTA